MKLEIRKEKTRGMVGKVKFSFYAIADLTDEERNLIKEFDAGKMVLFEYTKSSAGITDALASGMYVSSRLSSNFASVVLSLGIGKVKVNDLVRGRMVECSDIQEIMAAEDSMKAACQNLKFLLEEMKNFGGTEIFEIEKNTA